jgi:hypothetical protein
VTTGGGGFGLPPRKSIWAISAETANAITAVAMVNLRFMCFERRCEAAMKRERLPGSFAHPGSPLQTPRRLLTRVRSRQVRELREERLVVRGRVQRQLGQDVQRLIASQLEQDGRERDVDDRIGRACDRSDTRSAWWDRT